MRLTNVGRIMSLMALLGQMGNAQNHFAYLTDSGLTSDNVSVIDLNSTSATYNSVVASIPLDAPGCEIHFPKECSPRGIILTPDGTRAYVADMNGGAVSVIDTSTNRQIAAISFDPNPNNSVGREPSGVAATPDGRFVYVVNFNLAFGISVIDADPVSPTYNTVVDTVSMTSVTSCCDSAFGRDITISPDGELAYVSFSGGNRGGIAIIDISKNQVTDQIALQGADAESIAITPNGRFAYAAGFGPLIEFKTKNNAIVESLSLPGNLAGIAISPKGRLVYVTNTNGGVFVIDRDGNKNVVMATVPTSTDSYGIAITPDGSFVYVTNPASNTVSVIETIGNTVVATIPVGSSPQQIAIK